MIDLKTTIFYTKELLTALENVIVYDMKSVESDIDIEGSPDSALLQNYNTCGYILASIRDILNEFEKDGK